MSTTLNLNVFAEQALAMHAKMGCEVMQELGLVDAPTETDYYKLLLAKMYQMEPAIPEKECVPNGILDNTICTRIKEEVVAQDTVSSSIPVAQAAPVKLSSDFIKKNPLKFKKKQVGADGTEEEVEVSVDFPYLAAVDYSGTCQSLKISGGLLAPCLTRRPKGQNFCKACTKLGNPHGTIQDRENVSMLCYKSPKGKSELSFGTYVTKRGLDIDEVKAKILELYGTELPNEYWSVDKVKASRVVKTVSTSSDDEASVENGSDAKVVATGWKKRGRPKKSAEVVSAEEPAKVVSAEEPAEVVSAEEPAKVVSAEEPAEVVSAEEPAKVVSAEEPAKVVSAEEPAEVVSAKKPAEVVSAEEPAEVVSAKKAEKPKKAKKAKKAVKKAEKPAEVVSAKEADEASELTEEPFSDNEASLHDGECKENNSEKIQNESASMKNGTILKKLESGDYVVAWEGKTYVVDSSDNTVWSHESPTDYGLVDSVGEWDPETKTVELDDKEN